MTFVLTSHFDFLSRDRWSHLLLLPPSPPPAPAPLTRLITSRQHITSKLNSENAQAIQLSFQELVATSSLIATCAISGTLSLFFYLSSIDLFDTLSSPHHLTSFSIFKSAWANRHKFESLFTLKSGALLAKSRSPF